MTQNQTPPDDSIEPAGSSIQPPASAVAWWREPQWFAVVVLVVLIYFLRLDFLPMVGEEARWARGGVQMMETGDWIVPRQQLIPFPERPPMSSWAMALFGMLRGGIDPIAARLPSVLAVLLTSVLVYAYARSYLSALGASSAALCYATFGQVLQIGRHGESEALFTLFVAGSLLVWHHGYEHKWRAAAVWSAGYLLMALGALVKGPQAPVYFVAVIGAYLIFVKRDWRYLLRPAHGVGILLGASIIAAWEIPYWLMTDWATVRATWGGLAGDRFQLVGLLKHVGRYPVETLVCLLPWSPLLIALASKRFRVGLADLWPLTSFLLAALLVTYPTVWFASGARGRYFMPMYPCIAVLLGVILERSAQAASGGFVRMHLRNFLVGLGLVAVAGGGFIVLLSGGLLPADIAPEMKQPLWFALVFLAAAGLTAGVLIHCSRRISTGSLQMATLVAAAFVGLTYTGVVMNARANSWNNPMANVQSIKARLPDSLPMVSYGPIDFRFCYYFEKQVTELPWPTAVDEVPVELDYFFLAEHPNSTPEHRWVGRGRSWQKGPPTLPFEWEEVGRVVLDRRKNSAQRTVVLARVVREPNGRIAARRESTTSVIKR